MCYLVNYSNVLSLRCNLLQSTLLSDSYFVEQFQKSGYDAIEHALTKVNIATAFIIVCCSLHMNFWLICG